jgi:hypothetical protein
MSDDIGIDWGSAAVDGGTLTVPFTAKPPAEWIDQLGQVIARLQRGGGGWDGVEVAKKKLRVDGVRPGAESDLRHFLESAVLQANADLAEDDGGDGAERSGADREMTDTFRSFASG